MRRPLLLAIIAVLGLAAGWPSAESCWAQSVEEVPAPLASSESAAQSVLMPGQSLPFEPIDAALEQGEYIGPARAPHVPEYRLRVDDQLEFVFVAADAAQAGAAYRLQVGDALRILSPVDALANREVTIQPDGTIDLYLIGPLHAARLTVQELKQLIDEHYRKFYKVSNFSIQRTRTSARLAQLTGGEPLPLRVAPDGTISLPEIGSVPVQGLSLEEVRREINERYAEAAPGVSVTPILAARAPRHLFVVGAVQRPGRFTLQSPTTVLGGLSLAGGWTHGANLRQVVVLRRDENWQLVATTLDLRGASSGRGPCPESDLFLRDGDLIVVPKTAFHHAKHNWWRPLVPKGFFQPAADDEAEL